MRKECKTVILQQAFSAFHVWYINVKILTFEATAASYSCRYTHRNQSIS